MTHNKIGARQYYLIALIVTGLIIVLTLIWSQTKRQTKADNFIEDARLPETEYLSPASEQQQPPLGDIFAPEE